MARRTFLDTQLGRDQRPSLPMKTIAQEIAVAIGVATGLLALGTIGALAIVAI